MTKCTKCKRLAVYGTIYGAPTVCGTHRTDEPRADEKCAECPNSVVAGGRCGVHERKTAVETMPESALPAETAPVPVTAPVVETVHLQSSQSLQPVHPVSAPMPAPAPLSLIETQLNTVFLMIRELSSQISHLQTAAVGMPETLQGCLMVVLDRYRREDRDYRPSNLYVQLIFNQKNHVHMQASGDHDTIPRIRAALPTQRHDTIVPFMESLQYRLVNNCISSWDTYYRTTGMNPVRGDIIYDMTFHRSL